MPTRPSPIRVGTGHRLGKWLVPVRENTGNPMDTMKLLNQGLGRVEVAKFNVAQRVKVVDTNNPHDDCVGTVIVVTPQQDGFSYWLRFDPNPQGGRFNEEQLQAAS
jgi:hypothetical protein